MAVAKATKPHDLDHFLPAHLPHFSPRCSFFVLHDHRADAHPPYTHSARPSPLAPHAAKTVVGQEEEEGEEN